MNQTKIALSNQYNTTMRFSMKLGVMSEISIAYVSALTRF